MRGPGWAHFESISMTGIFSDGTCAEHAAAGRIHQRRSRPVGGSTLCMLLWRVGRAGWGGG